MRASETPTVVLYGAPGCHLCDTASGILAEYERRGFIRLRHVNIRGCADLEQAYGLRIPVVCFPDGSELSWPFGANDFRAVLDRAQARAPSQ